MQPGDVPVTFADGEALERDFGFTPTIGIREGLRKFAEWYRINAFEGKSESIEIVEMSYYPFKDESHVTAHLRIHHHSIHR